MVGKVRGQGREVTGVVRVRSSPDDALLEQVRVVPVIQQHPTPANQT